MEGGGGEGWEGDGEGGGEGDGEGGGEGDGEEGGREGRGMERRGGGRGEGRMWKEVYVCGELLPPCSIC